MTKVFTANVFITKSSQAIEQLFFGENKVTSYSKRLEYLSKDDLAKSFIVSPESNDGMLDFEYSFGMSKGNDHAKVVATFVETSKALEFLLIDDDPTAKMLIHVAGKLKNINIEQKNATLVNKKGLMELSETPIGVGNRNFNYLDKGKKERQSSALDRLKATNRYYFAFGAGDDLTTWDGPHSMDLVAATLSNDDANNREVTVTFVPNIGSFAQSWTRQFEKEMGYGNTIKKFNQALQASDFIKSEGLTTFGIEKVIDATAARKSAYTYPFAFTMNANQPSMEYYASLLPSLAVYSIEMNNNVRTLLRNFIGSVTNTPGNVVVAFPQQLSNMYTSLNNKSPYQLELTDQYKDYLGRLGITATFNKPVLRQGNKQDYKDKYFDRRKDSQVTEDENSISSQKFTALLDNANPQEDADRLLWRSWLQSNQSTESKKSDLVEAYVNFAATPPRVGFAESLAQLQGPYRAFCQTITVMLPGARAAAEERSNIAPGTQFSLSTEFIYGSAGQVNPIYDNLVSEALAKTLSDIPDGMNPDGQGNTQEYTEKKIAEIENRFAPGGMSNTQSALNTISSWDFLTEQVSKAVTNFSMAASGYRADYNATLLEDFKTGKAQRTITLSMLNTNKSSEGKVSGFSPPLSPLVKFSQGLIQAFSPSVKERIPVFDFFEETDLRVLKLWKDYGIIEDASRSAFVFGDIKSIKRTLYLDGYSKSKDDPLSLPTWKSCTPGIEFSFPHLTAYDSYKKEFLNIFFKKSSKRSSFETYSTFDKSIKKQLESRGLDYSNKDIILTHNTENSNVVSLDFATKNYIASLLTLDVRPEFDNQLIGTSRKSLVAEIAKETFDEEKVKDLLSSKSKDRRTDLLGTPSQRRKLARVFAEAITNNGKNGEELAGVQLYDSTSLLIALEKFQKSNDTNTQSTKVTKADNYKNVMQEVMDRYARQLFEIKVQTLPFFNHKIFPGKSCGLMGMTGGIVGGDKKLRHLAPYTGEYSIQGWKHVLSSSEISTTLLLIREGFESSEVTNNTTLKFVKQELQAWLAELKNNRDKTDKYLSITPLPPAGHIRGETYSEWLERRFERDAEYKESVGYEKNNVQIEKLEALIGSLPQ